MLKLLGYASDKARLLMAIIIDVEALRGNVMGEEGSRLRIKLG
jgi:hypothetical protein